MDNTGTALRMNALNGKAYVANSIILRNGTQDCQIETTDKVRFTQSSDSTCGTGDAAYPNQI